MSCFIRETTRLQINVCAMEYRQEMLHSTNSGKNNDVEEHHNIGVWPTMKHASSELAINEGSSHVVYLGQIVARVLMLPMLNNQAGLMPSKDNQSLINRK